MNMQTRIKLSTMMFLEFFIWGAWFVTMGNYLGKGLLFTDPEITRAYSTTGWAAIISPFFLGMVADRFFSAEKVLGLAHLLGGVILFYASTVTTPGLFFWAVLAYALCYMPTLALVNAVALNQVTDAEKELPSVRVLGTIGWIVAGILIWLLGYLGVENVEATALPLKIAAGASILMGLYSFFLPKTPPKESGKKVTVGDILGLEALKLMKDRSFAVFVLASLLVCIPLAFYYSFANYFLNDVGVTKVVLKMGVLGQGSEIIFMLVMPFFFRRLGVKKMLLFGMLAWVVRYVLFAYGNPGSLVFMLYGGLLLHGICYDFFFVTGQIYVDNVAPKEIRASAQGFLALVTYGAGMVIGNKIAGIVGEHYTTLDEVTQAAGHLWTNVWLIPAVMAAVIVVLFGLLFTEKKKAAA